MSQTTSELQNGALQKNAWPLKEIFGLSLLTSPLLSESKALTHAFTTRLGGKSADPLQWFNLGRHWATDESRQDASVNRSKLCSALSLNFNRLIVPGQVHSTRIAWVSEPESAPDIDGVATVTPDTPILLHYADCVPIIIFERELSAVCVLHAGWKGTAGGIATKGVSLLNQVLGSSASNMVAAVGPAIGPCCYPVEAEVADRLAVSVSNAEGLISFEQGKPHPDLKAINAMQLLEAGVAAVDVSSFCTACNPELFYSHRQSAGKTGRQGAIAGIRTVD